MYRSISRRRPPKSTQKPSPPPKPIFEKPRGQSVRVLAQLRLAVSDSGPRHVERLKTGFRLPAGHYCPAKSVPEELARSQSDERQRANFDTYRASSLPKDLFPLARLWWRPR